MGSTPREPGYETRVVALEMPGQLISLKTQEEKWVRQVRGMQRQRKPRCNALMKKHFEYLLQQQELEFTKRS